MSKSNKIQENNISIYVTQDEMETNGGKLTRFEDPFLEQNLTQDGSVKTFHDDNEDSDDGDSISTTQNMTQKYLEEYLEYSDIEMDIVNEDNDVSSLKEKN